MNNRKTAGSIQLILTLVVVIFIALYICSLTIDLLKITWLQWLSGILALLTVIYFTFGGFYYIDIEKTDDHFEIKYYNTFPFARSFKMFRIPIQAFIKYDVTGFRYFKRKLFLYQMSASQMAKYPPVYISAFSKKDEINMVAFFQNLKHKN